MTILTGIACFLIIFSFVMTGLYMAFKHFDQPFGRDTFMSKVLSYCNPVSAVFVFLVGFIMLFIIAP